MPTPTAASEIHLIETFADTRVIGVTINHEHMSDDEVDAAPSAPTARARHPRHRRPAAPAVASWSTWSWRPSRRWRGGWPPSCERAEAGDPPGPRRAQHRAAGRSGWAARGIGVTAVTKVDAGRTGRWPALSCAAGVAGLADSRVDERRDACAAAGVSSPGDPGAHADAEPGRRGGATCCDTSCNTEPERARRAVGRSAAPRTAVTVWCSWSSWATSARGSCPTTSRRSPSRSREPAEPGAAWHRREPGVSQRRGARRGEHGGAVGAGRARRARHAASSSRSSPVGTRRTSAGPSGTAPTGRINDLRLGEALLLGVDPRRASTGRRAAHRCPDAGRRGDRVGSQAVAAVGHARADRVRRASRRARPRRGRADDPGARPPGHRHGRPDRRRPA